MYGAICSISPRAVDAANAPIIPVLVDHRMIKVIMVLLVMLPVSLLRNISTLEKVS